MESLMRVVWEIPAGVLAQVPWGSRGPTAAHCGVYEGYIVGALVQVSCQ